MSTLHQLKERLRRVPGIAPLNAHLKRMQLKSGLQALSARYQDEAMRRGLAYDEEAAIAHFRFRVQGINSTAAPRKPGELRVFWIGSNRDQDESGYLQALRRTANVVEFRNWKGTYGQWYWDETGRVRVYDPAITRKNDSCLIEQVESALAEGPIDVLLAQTWSNYVSSDAIRKVRARGIPFVNISMDDRLPDNWATRQGVRMGAVGLAQVTDLVLTTSAESCLWYTVEGCPAMFWPLASDPSVFSAPPEAQRDIDVLFIGNRYGIREMIVRDLQARGIAVECRGTGWPKGPATAEEAAALSKRARIILGIGTVGYCRDVYTLKLRDFDAPMSGALYLTHRNPDLLRLYAEGREIECYANADEAADKVQYYLAHPPELHRVAAAGHRKASTRDTWDIRLSDTFQRLGFLS